jgi:hypothetical protein
MFIPAGNFNLLDAEVSVAAKSWTGGSKLQRLAGVGGRRLARYIHSADRVWCYSHFSQWQRRNSKLHRHTGRIGHWNGYWPVLTPATTQTLVAWNQAASSTVPSLLTNRPPLTAGGRAFSGAFSIPDRLHVHPHSHAASALAHPVLYRASERGYVSSAPPETEQLADPQCAGVGGGVVQLRASPAEALVLNDELSRSVGYR